MFGSLLLRLIVAQLNLTVQAPYYSWTYASQQKLLLSLKAYKKKSLKKNAYIKKRENKTPQLTNQKNPTKTFFSIAISGQKKIRIMTSTESPFKCSCLQLFSHNSYSIFGHYLGNKSWNSHREMYLKNKGHLIILEFLTLDSLGCSPKQSKLNHHIQLWSLKLTLRSQQAFDFAILLSYSQKNKDDSFLHEIQLAQFKAQFSTERREHTKEKLIDNVKEIEKC